MESDSAQKHPQQLIFENVSPATRLLEKRRQMYEVQDALETQKLRFVKDEEQFKKKEDTLRAKDLQLQHQLIRFNKFLQDNEAKRRRAETRAAEESAQIKQREEEIAELEQTLEESKQKCLDLDDEVQRNMKYEEFLERVKNEYEEYSEITELLTRYDTLESANRDLMNNQTYFENKNEEIRLEFQQYKKARDMEILAFTNRIATLQSDLEEGQKQRQTLEHQADEATQEDSEHSLHFGQVLMSVENLFLRCTDKRTVIQHHVRDTGEGEVAEDDETEKDSFKHKQSEASFHLRVLLDYLKDFKDITEILQRDRRLQGQGKKKVEQLEPQKIPDPEFVTHLPEGARGSANASSTSPGNTRDFRNVKNSGPVDQSKTLE